MKRNKHILINLSDPEYNAIEKLAAAARRKIADFVYLKLIDALTLEIAQSLKIAESEFKKISAENIKL